MQTLSLIPECVITLSSKEEGSIGTYEDLTTLPLKSHSHQTLYLANHEHMTGTWVINRENRDQVEQAADIVLTREKEAVIVHQFADCVPFLLVDRRKKALCFAHLGWKGLTMGGVQASVLSMRAEFDSTVDDLWAWIGPCIQKKSYTFAQPPVQKALPVWKDAISAVDETWSVDLPGFILSECVRFGLDQTRVISDGRDTYEETEMFFSHQRSLREGDESDHGVFVVACSLL